MKNKHLFLIFVATLAVGYVARQLPLPFRRAWSGEIVRLDTALVRQFTVQPPGATELVFERTESGWTVVQDVRSVLLTPDQVAPLLAALSSVRSVTLIKTERPDTLGLHANEALQVVVYDADGEAERFWLGRQKPSDAGRTITYFRPADHDALYVVEGALRTRFEVTLDQFRDPTVFTLDPDDVSAVAFAWRNHAPLYFLGPDSTAQWRAPDGRALQPDSTVQRWLRLLQRLATMPPAEYFDESRAGENYLARIGIERAGAAEAEEAPLVLKFFYVAPPEAPDDVEALRTANRRLSPYVLESSQRPGSFFAVDDTMLAWQICFALLPPRDTLPKKR